MPSIREAIGKRFAKYLNGEVGEYLIWCAASPEALRRTLRPGDVLLVDGNRRMSRAIRFATQSIWTHAAYFVGDGDGADLIEAEVEKGVIAVGLERFLGLNTRICRPVGLDDEGIAAVSRRMRSAIGKSYDLKNVFDLARYLVPVVPVPARFRRQLLALGSGDPTRAICSSLIAEAFQNVGYPVLPHISFDPVRGADAEVLYIRHKSLYVPRDFDLSPYFAIVKPTLEQGFDYHSIRMDTSTWPEDEPLPRAWTGREKDGPGGPDDPEDPDDAGAAG
ncbi:lipo-like protein [Paracoccus pacificus]|uniref:Lipo-like protein n=1 Tax=Paracoccus pacificus TaxID=1463598 RepID=A0ABW4RC17_9RHOB